MGGAFGTFTEIEADVLQRNFQVNTMALFHLARLTTPAMVAAGEGALIVTGVWAKWFPVLRTADRLE